MNGNSLGVLSSGALAGAERSKGERSEPQRSAAAAKAAAGSRSVAPLDSEVVARPNYFGWLKTIALFRKVRHRGTLKARTAFFFQLLCPATDRLATHTDLSSNLRLNDAFFE